MEGLPEHREQASRWLKVENTRVGFGVSGHQLLTAILLGFTSVGDKIACEEITYNGWINITRHIGRTNVPIESDDHGMLPEALEEATKKEKLWGIFLMPSLHNPLNTVMPLARRKALIEVCRKHGLWVIDDDAYRFLNPDAPLSFAHLYPEKSFWLQSLTKPLFASVKTSLIVAPETSMPKLYEALRATGHQPSALTLPWVLDLLGSGAADRLSAEKQNEARRRLNIALPYLEGLTIKSFPTSFHLWVSLSDGWTAIGAYEALKAQSVLVVSGANYQINVHQTSSSLRLALSAVENEVELRQALEIIRKTLISNT